MSFEALKFGNFGWNMPAWIDARDGRAPRECAIRDLSASAATLSVAHASALPDDFVLRLSASGSLAKPCHVVARDAQGMRVAFV